MSFGTVSFEELLGHCNQIYKSNQEELLNLQDRLADFGYVPGKLFMNFLRLFFLLCLFLDLKVRFLDIGVEIDEGRDEECEFGAIGHEDSKHSNDDLESPSLQRSLIKRFDEDDLYPFCMMLSTCLCTPDQNLVLRCIFLKCFL